jgi:hypothetical protein
MSEKTTCKADGCKSTEFRYAPAAPTEEGWCCARCDLKPGEPLGFCPELDASDTSGKVTDILFRLTGETGGPSWLYISNGTEGEGVVHSVVQQCQEAGIYDQSFIVLRLFAAADYGETHSAFWKKISDGVRAGNDPRVRCACGQLATAGGECSACWSKRAKTPF